MSNYNDDFESGPFMVIGAVLFILFFVTLIGRALKKLFIELGLTFDAFASMAGSFFVMAFAILKVVALVACLGGGAIAAVYFTYRYIKMVKRGTALREYVRSKIEGELETYKHQINIMVNAKLIPAMRQVDQLDAKVQKLLATPTPLAPEASALSLPTQMPVPAEEAKGEEEGESEADADCGPDCDEPTDETDETDDEEVAEPQIFPSNPY